MHMRPHFGPGTSKVAFRLGTMYASSLEAGLSSRRTSTAPAVDHVYKPMRGMGSAAFGMSFCQVNVSGPHHANSVYLLTDRAKSQECGDTIRRIDVHVPCQGATKRERRVLFPKLPSIRAKDKSLSLGTADSYKLPISCCVGRNPTRVRKSRVMFAPVPPHDGFPMGIAMIT